jgi:predicted  nucleic acid-binding Zn-ribbon protein
MNMKQKLSLHYSLAEIMKEQNPLIMSQRELLIRIDERQKNMGQDIQTLNEKMESINNTLLGKVENNVEYHEMKAKVDTIWDWKNKVMGYVAAISLVVSTVSGFVFWLLQRYLFPKG